jgi:hypothetical protein
MIIRIQPHFYAMTPLGEAEVHFLETDDGVENYPIWHCFQTETNEPWAWPNPLIRIAGSISGLRSGKHSPIFLSEELLADLRPHIVRHVHSPFWEGEKGNG